LMHRPTEIVVERTVVKEPASSARSGRDPKKLVMPAQLLLHSHQLHQVSTDILMSVGDGFLEGVDREQVSGFVVQSLTHIVDRVHQKNPKAAALIDGIQLDADEMRAVLGALKLMSDSRVQSVGLDVARALSQRHVPTDRWSIVDRIHRQLMPRVGEIRLLREELLPLALRSWTPPQHSWALTLARTNVKAMQGLDEHWPKTIEKTLAPVPAGGIIPVWNDDDASTDASNSLQPAEALVPDDVTTRNQKLAATSPVVSADKASVVAAGMLEVSRGLFDILEQGCWLSRNKHALTASEGQVQQTANAGITAMLDESLMGSRNSPVLCGPPEVGSKVPEQALACRLKFGAQGLDALRAAPEIRVFRR